VQRDVVSQKQKDAMLLALNRDKRTMTHGIETVAPEAENNKGIVFSPVSNREHGSGNSTKTHIIT
jgi:hypothetical protein